LTKGNGGERMASKASERFFACKKETVLGARERARNNEVIPAKLVDPQRGEGTYGWVVRQRGCQGLLQIIITEGRWKDIRENLQKVEKNGSCFRTAQDTMS